VVKLPACAAAINFSGLVPRHDNNLDIVRTAGISLRILS
jgi:hypothetical protein